MTDKDYKSYAEEVQSRIRSLSGTTVDTIAKKVLLRLRKEHADLFVIPQECTGTIPNKLDTRDIMALLIKKYFTFERIHQDLGTIIDRYIMECYEELDEKKQFFLTYRYIGDFRLTDDVKENMIVKMKAHYFSKHHDMLKCYPELMKFLAM